MIIRVLDDSDEVIWSNGEKSGVAVIAHRKDGTHEKIIAALETALAQAREQASESSAPC